MGDICIRIGEAWVHHDGMSSTKQGWLKGISGCYPYSKNYQALPNSSELQAIEKQAERQAQEVIAGYDSSLQSFFRAIRSATGNALFREMKIRKDCTPCIEFGDWRQLKQPKDALTKLSAPLPGIGGYELTLEGVGTLQVMNHNADDKWDSIYFERDKGPTLFSLKVYEYGYFHAHSPWSIDHDRMPAFERGLEAGITTAIENVIRDARQ